MKKTTTIASQKRSRTERPNPAFDPGKPVQVTWPRPVLTQPANDAWFPTPEATPIAPDSPTAARIARAVLRAVDQTIGDSVRAEVGRLPPPLSLLAHDDEWVPATQSSLPGAGTVRRLWATQVRPWSTKGRF